MQCAYCERPLVCDSCQAEFHPPTPVEYEAMSEVEEEILCPACGETLVCHWCKTAYDGSAEDESEGAQGS